MRGEYKVPGGKLVAVDCEVRDGHLSQVHLSGDFFLEPDDALEQINQVLTGLPVTTSAARIGELLEARLGDITMIGFTPLAVGIAVRRALGHAVGWNDLTFDVIPAVMMPPIMHVALDEVLLDEVSAGRRRPTFRLWDWDSPLVVMGSYQSYRNEIDDENARQYGIDVVRRISGGGAMFMEPGNCITYSLYVPGALVEGLSFEQSYAFLDDWVLGALKGVGIQARYVPLNDIASEHGKIGGAAQRRLTDGTVLHHVTSAYDIDADKMVQVLRIGREKMSDKGTRSANKRVDPMRSQTGLPREQIMEHFLNHFRSLYRCEESTYTDDELARAEELVRTKFATPEWTHRIP